MLPKTRICVCSRRWRCFGLASCESSVGLVRETFFGGNADVAVERRLEPTGVCHRLPEEPERREGHFYVAAMISSGRTPVRRR